MSLGAADHGAEAAARSGRTLGHGAWPKFRERTSSRRREGLNGHNARAHSRRSITANRKDRIAKYFEARS